MRSIDDEIDLLLTWARIFEFPRRHKPPSAPRYWLRPHPGDLAKADALRAEAKRLVEGAKQVLPPAT